MSWDIWIARYSQIYKSTDEIPNEEYEQPLPLGSKSNVRRAVSAIFPTTNWQDLTWGRWESEFGSIEFNVGANDPVLGISLNVRANDAVVPAIVQLCKQNSWQGIDFSTGDFLEQSRNPEAGLAAWKAFRDKVVGK